MRELKEPVLNPTIKIIVYFESDSKILIDQFITALIERSWDKGPLSNEFVLEVNGETQTEEHIDELLGYPEFDISEAAHALNVDGDPFEGKAIITIDGIGEYQYYFTSLDNNDYFVEELDVYYELTEQKNERLS